MVKKVCFAVVLAVVMMLATACEKAKVVEPEGEQGKVEVSEEGQMSINMATIIIHTAGKTVNVTAELAVTADERSKGLKGRESLPKNYGMWFVFPEDVEDPFWMRDTLIALDMIFVGGDMRVIDIKAGTTPGSEEELKPAGLYRYVLEIPAGFAAENGIKVGDHVIYGMGPQ